MTAYACLRYPDADAALEFLQAAFGFEPEAVHRAETGRVEHAQVRAGKSLIMVGEHRGEGPYARMLGRGWTYVAVAEVDALCARASAAGAEITMELTDQPHGPGTSPRSISTATNGTLEPTSRDPSRGCAQGRHCPRF